MSPPKKLGTFVDKQKLKVFPLKYLVINLLRENGDKQKLKVSPLN